MFRLSCQSQRPSPPLFAWRILLPRSSAASPAACVRPLPVHFIPFSLFHRSDYTLVYRANFRPMRKANRVPVWQEVSSGRFQMNSCLIQISWGENWRHTSNRMLELSWAITKMQLYAHILPALYCICSEYEQRHINVLIFSLNWDLATYSSSNCSRTNWYILDIKV